MKLRLILNYNLALGDRAPHFMPLLAPLLLSLGTCPAAPDASREVVERRVAVMGTMLELRLEAATRPVALRASEQAVRALEAVEARLSTWNVFSELSRLNAAEPGVPFELSAELARDLGRAAEVCAWTEGAFDPVLGGLVEAWGLRTGGRVPTRAEREAARAAGGLDGLRLEGRTATRLRAGARVEEGGFGKGVGLDEALAALDGSGVSRGLLDIGGQVAVLASEEPYSIAVADPRERGRAVVEVAVQSGSLATTANSERGIEVDGRRFAHVLDPRTGHPAEDFGSLTVWAPDATTADALSTGLYVLGPDRALAWALEHEDFEVLTIEPTTGGSLLVRATPGLARRARPLTEDTRLSPPTTPDIDR